jgi:hypothetical protein
VNLSRLTTDEFRLVFALEFEGGDGTYNMGLACVRRDLETARWNCIPDEEFRERLLAKAHEWLQGSPTRLERLYLDAVPLLVREAMEMEPAAPLAGVALVALPGAKA